MTKFALDSKYPIKGHFVQTVFMAENCTILQSQVLIIEYLFVLL